MLVCGTSQPDNTTVPAASKLAAATKRLRFMLIPSRRTRFVLRIAVVGTRVQTNIRLTGQRAVRRPVSARKCRQQANIERRVTEGWPTNDGISPVLAGKVISSRERHRR